MYDVYEGVDDVWHGYRSSFRTRTGIGSLLRRGGKGLTLSAWLRAAARERLAARRSDEPFETAEDLAAFFRECDAIDGPEREPDWEEQRKVLRESQLSGTTNT